jgi:hypothetical protein
MPSIQTELCHHPPKEYQLLDRRCSQNHFDLCRSGKNCDKAHIQRLEKEPLGHYMKPNTMLVLPILDIASLLMTIHKIGSRLGLILDTFLRLHTHYKHDRFLGTETNRKSNSGNLWKSLHRKNYKRNGIVCIFL